MVLKFCVYASIRDDPWVESYWQIHDGDALSGEWDVVRDPGPGLKV